MNWRDWLPSTGPEDWRLGSQRGGFCGGAAQPRWTRWSTSQYNFLNVCIHIQILCELYSSLSYTWISDRIHISQYGTDNWQPVRGFPKWWLGCPDWGSWWLQGTLSHSGKLATACWCWPAFVLTSFLSYKTCMGSAKICWFWLECISLHLILGFKENPSSQHPKQSIPINVDLWLSRHAGQHEPGRP